MANVHVSRAGGWGVRGRASVGATLTALSGVGLLGGLPACGGSSTSSTASAAATSRTAGTGTPSATTPTSKGPTEAQQADDRATARDSTLKLSEFPSGWVESDQSSSSGTTCPSVEPAKNAASGTAETPTFAKGETDGVHNAVYIYPTVAEAQRVFPALSVSETLACVAHNTEKEVKKNATENANFGQATSGQLSAPPLGDQSAAGRVTVPYTNANLRFSLNIDLQLVRVSRGIQVLTFLTLPGTFDSTLDAKLTRPAANRPKAELRTAPNTVSRRIRMTRKLLIALLPIAVMAVVPSISAAKRGLKGDDKYVVAYDSYFPGGKTSTNETIPPRSFIMDCLNVAQSTVNRDWASVTFRYPWALQHPAKCPPRFLANGLRVMYIGSSEFWERTLDAPYDGCPTYKPMWGPKLPPKVARDLFPDLCH